MRPISDRIRLVGPDDLTWDFDGSGPSFETRGPSSAYGRTHRVDPFPCYAHDLALVGRTVSAVEQKFPIGADVQYFLTQFETVGRTNGFQTDSAVYDPKTHKQVGFDAFVVLVGKRIPPHPAMTRYLVAHEYGHVAQKWLEQLRGIDSSSGTTDLDEEYARLRRGSNNLYGSLRWHSNVGELFANDFRILVCGVETEFWPHEGFSRPEETDEVRDFWSEAVEQAMEAAAKSEQLLSAGSPS